MEAHPALIALRAEPVRALMREHEQLHGQHQDQQQALQEKARVWPDHYVVVSLALAARRNVI